MTVEKKKDILIFLVGCFATFPITIVGRIYIGELLIFLSYLFIPWKFAFNNMHIKRFLNFGMLWLVSAILSDFWRQTPQIDMIKGATSIIFLLSLFPFAYWALYDKPSRWVIFFFGTVVSSQLTYYLVTAKTEFGSEDIWQIYAYNPLANAAAVFLYLRGHRNTAYLLLLTFGLWILYNGSRNVFLCDTIAVVILYTIDRLQNLDIHNQLYFFRRNFKYTIIAIIGGLLLVDFTYESLASNKILGEYAQDKYYKQKNSDLGLASGRIEVVMDIDLISKEPLIGYGSYAKDKEGYVSHFYAKHNIVDYRKFSSMDSIENMMPRHSRIFGLWMWHGIGAGLFWIFTLYSIAFFFKRGDFIYEPRLIALCIISGMSQLWDTFFSPMAERLPLVFFLTYLIIMNEYSRNTRKSIPDLKKIMRR